MKIRKLVSIRRSVHIWKVVLTHSFTPFSQSAID